MLDDIDSSKTTGFDNIPSKLLKSASQELVKPVTTLGNQSIGMSYFPHDLKNAELSLLYKCKDDLLFTSYRPVSVLTALSKLFEKVYNDQMTEHFTELLCSFLSTFRRNFGCHHVLTKLIEDCKIALDRGKNFRLLLLGLSKAFDCLRKGVPQGSVLGSLLFNTSLNDIHFISSHNISIYNDADDNTI